MIWFLICAFLLILGFFTYGKFVEKIFGIDPNRQTPAYELRDGVDYIPMNRARVWLIQVLNIAGIGPIFGPILGAIYGPVAMFWIVFGTILAGAVHDFAAGMISVRNKGQSLPNLAGNYLGSGVKHGINVLTLILMILVGVVFVTTPAGLLTNLTEQALGRTGELTQATNPAHKHLLVMWIVIIFAYYIVATLLPINKIIGKIYPFFGAFLMFMTLGMFCALLFRDITFFRTLGIPENFSIAAIFKNYNPSGAPIFPLIFITIACGAISGFHATQSPMMARCIRSEKEARFVFYGAMVTEGLIALIWCVVGMSFYPEMQTLLDTIKTGTASAVVYDSAITMLGKVGGVCAIIGVVVLPITSGDTAFRAARLQIADFLKLNQISLKNRLIIIIPMFILGIFLCTIDFQTLWQYFGWANQTTATVMLWICAAFLYRTKKLHWIATAPAIFMNLVCSSYLFYHKIGFGWVWDNIGLGSSKLLCANICSLILTAGIFYIFIEVLNPNKHPEKYIKNMF